MAHIITGPCLASTRNPSGRPASDGVEACVQTIEGGYREWPALSLTKAQMQRLWLIDRALCEAAVNCLVERGQLQRAPNDTYRRRHA